MTCLSRGVHPLSAACHNRWAPCIIELTRSVCCCCRYKEQSGTEVDPAAAAQAQLEYDKGQQLFDQKDLAAALPLFAAAAVLVPARSGIGGKARLQQAICLDSLARGEPGVGRQTACYGQLHGLQCTSSLSKLLQAAGLEESIMPSCLQARRLKLSIQPSKLTQTLR